MILSLSFLAAACLLCALGASPAVCGALDRMGPLRRLRAGSDRLLSRLEWPLFALLLAAALALRVCQALPGIGADEMLIAVQGRALLGTGADLSGVPFPAFLPGYASSTAMGPLLPLLTAPFTALLGMTELAVRLPAQLIALLSLALSYLLARRIGGRRMALFALLALALSPWHVMASRFLNAGMAALCMVALCALLLACGRYTAAGVALGLSMYVSDGLWLVAPAMQLFAVLYLPLVRRVPLRRLLPGLLLFLLVLLPALCTIAVNALDLPSFRLLLATIPRLPTAPQTLTTIFSQGFSFDALEGTAVSLLEWLVCAVKLDEFGGTNAYIPYEGGLVFLFTLPLLAGGLLCALSRARAGRARFALLAMLFAACALPRLLCPTVSIEHMLPLLLPTALLAALCASEISRRLRLVGTPALCALYAAATLALVPAVYGEDFVYSVESEFRAGFMPAAEYARAQAPEHIIVTNALYPCVDSQHLGEAMARFALDLPADASVGDGAPVQVAGLSGRDLSPVEGTVYLASMNDLDYFDWDAYDIQDFGLYTVFTPLEAGAAGAGDSEGA
ncbi:MAG TPA: glycosyltransferase family 39 protein [Candidatus Onthenecus intestinigallinarum]|uniref:Glycosyltransferase family 39 protein n=1 Tax=Candidatus Onthenecus intestinigallinarum TaxID=2840875 RepID=A0A9D1CRB8_9FIRM|nr:glycosyltransferase family 39 protein [Candidatus Onthenecus intestinigallinarum]